LDRTVDFGTQALGGAEDVEHGGKAGVETSRHREDGDAHVANGSERVAIDVGRPPSFRGVKVEAIDVGAFSSPAAIWRRGEDEGRWERFPVPAYLVEVGGERILIDTGLHPAAVADPAGHYGGTESLALFRLEQAASVVERVDLATVTTVVVTHLHFDHA